MYTIISSFFHTEFQNYESRLFTSQEQHVSKHVAIYGQQVKKQHFLLILYLFFRHAKLVNNKSYFPNTKFQGGSSKCPQPEL